MITTLDGRATIAGRSGPIGDEADRQLFHGLRTQADAVMVGAGTATIEHYGKLVKSDELAERRRRDGLSPDPVAVIVSGSLGLRVDEVPLLRDASSRVAVITHAERAIDGAEAQVEYVRVPPGAGSLAHGIAELGSRLGVRSIICEGGPTLNRSLLGEALVDELFLSLAPKLAGGEPAFTALEGASLPEPLDAALLSCHESDGSLFLRYAIRRG
jgi:riboflavin biosynthesis pyrimidine reductase